MTSPALHTPLVAPLRHQRQKLTTAKPEIPALLVRDPSTKEITARASLSPSTVERRPEATGEKDSCPPRHVLVRAILSSGQLPRPRAPRPTHSEWRSQEIRLLRAFAQHLRPTDMTDAAGIAACGVPRPMHTPVDSAGVGSATGLIRYGHLWNLLDPRHARDAAGASR
ncbi:hypothetical protein [Streptomyces sp. SUK 48]|uniref:hypothetical protein n=1 Tax=Streptomyces sp. SUK 48 TaxID=2582831 RepID=UPI00129A2235|nr:hypothetical protein [Streptomyces sp. SUK 48]